ncbi:MAG: proprotein convertase P-domain-containing protein [Bacillota bacterium]
MRQVVELLEDRTLLSTLPLPDVTGHADIVPQGVGNYNSPAIAYDPSKPQRLVSVYGYHGPTNTTRVLGSYSADGGTTWVPFTLPDNMRNPLLDTGLYDQAGEPSVAFDAAGNFYITYVEYTGDNRQAGAVVLQKYGFDIDDVPQNLDTSLADGAQAVLYQWVGTVNPDGGAAAGDRAFNPYVAVDTNPARFVDVTSRATVTDKYAGTVYVAWSAELQQPNGQAPVHKIMLTGSKDGGTTFGTQRAVNDDGDASYPRMVVSGGTADGRVVPGQLSLIWDDYRSDTGSTIYLDKVLDGGQGWVVNGGAKDIVDGKAPDPLPDPLPDPPPPAVTTHTPGVTTASVLVNLPAGFVASDVDLELALSDPALEQLSIQLSHGGKTIDLVRNGKDGDDQSTGAGITGAGMGITRGLPVGAVFDDQALRSVRDGAAPFIGHFQAEGGATALASLIAGGAGGQWTLTITDYRQNPDGAASGKLESWALRFTSGLTTNADVAVATTKLLGSLDGPFADTPDVMPERGIGPSAAIASDNTLGSFSPYQGRLYVAYTNGSGDKTDIFLRTSDDGGNNWSEPVRVNNDDGSVDHFSDGVRNTRPHFQPEVAVDQTTGTVVLSFYDARHDASRVRVARYIATSIDGGTTFGPQTYANEPNLATDAITGRPVDLGPVPDNQSKDYADRDQQYSFGDRQGLAVVNGRINLAWSGNRNSNVDRVGLGILGAVAQIAAGPRIVDNSGTMGPVSLPGDTLNPATADGLPQFSKFEVTFDRPIDPATFTNDAVTVLYRDIYTSGNDPGTIVTVKSVTAEDIGSWGPAGIDGATKFLIELETPQTGVGTYSYFIKPTMKDRIRTLTSSGNPVDQDSDGVAGEAAVADTSVGDVYAIPRPTADTAFNGTYFVPSFDSHTLPIIVPGTRVADTGAATVYWAKGDQVNLRVPPVGSGGSGVAADDNTRSTITFPASSYMRIEDLNLRLTLDHESDGDLQIVLIAPDGTEVMLANGLGGSNQGYYDTVFDDGAKDRIIDALPPFTGVFQPEQPLSALNGKALAGTWTLEIRDGNSDGGVGSLYSWSMEVTTSASMGENLVLNNTVSSLDVKFDRDMDPSTFTPGAILRMMGPAGVISGPFEITPNPLGTDPDPDYPRTYRISFPMQQISGTYTITLASSLTSKDGFALDGNLNAGVDLLFDRSTTTIPVTVKSTEVKLIGSRTESDVVTESYINVTDAFVIQGVTVRLNISYPNDPDLRAVLTAPDGTTISLFYDVGSAGLRRNFTDTVFDDAATTPIQNGAAPFFGRFNPRPSVDLPLTLNDLKGMNVQGEWKLSISTTKAGAVGTLNNWSLTFQKAQPISGVGETVADQYTTSFRIFTTDVTEDLSHNTWVPVGPNEAGGRTTAIAVDPSDPSGNTVYVGSASGGLWKTTNFLTSDSAGPTYTPLTDFGPALAMRIGSIAVFPRNGDPNQSIIIAGTGEGDDRTTGIGFLLSMDGGATWAVLDSATNVGAAGNWLPMSSSLRNHIFVGTTVYRVVVDPRPTPAGETIIYAALSSPNANQGAGGIWRSLDTGKHWERMRAGNATDVILDANSGYLDAYGNPSGNLQTVYGAFRGVGVLRSPNRGQMWLAMPGGTGVPTIRDADDITAEMPSIPVTNNTGTPNGAKGRIVLARPALTGDSVKDMLYQGWLYAAVVSENAGREGAFDGLYVTKDYGQNWTKVRLPNIEDPDIPHLAYPTNDTTKTDYDVVSGDLLPQGTGNYDLSLAVDPSNPSVVYIGGTTRTGGPGLIRVDIAALADPYALYTAHDRPGGGKLDGDATDAVVVKDPNLGGIADGYVNLLQDPEQPFAVGSMVLVSGVASIANSGTGGRWSPFDRNLLPGGFHYLHQLLTVTDPATGKTRLIIADDQGVYSTVDDGTGQIEQGIGTRTAVRGDRSGNLQVAQFLYGAAQPNSVAAQAAGALFYGSTEHMGVRVSAVDILENGTLVWGSDLEASQGGTGGVATSPGGGGGWYLTRYPADNLISPEFFLWNDIGRTWGLLQQTTTQNWTGDAQWPDVWASNFAVNPVDPNQIVIGSATGRVFTTTNQGRFWTSIGEPGDLDGTYVRTFAYGAPDFNGTNGNDATNFLLYAGTSQGNVFVTSVGGSIGNRWQRLSVGLDGSPIQSIVTNPLRGSREVYVVTAQGVYHMADSLADNAQWVNITGNLMALTYNPFGDASLAEPQVQSLTSITADWRYVIPDDSANPNGATHPVLYVAGAAGVFRSLDAGKTWRVFPDNAVDGAPVNGGYLPNVRVNDLDLAIGSINPMTGREVVAGSPDVLLATTYGRGLFAIRVAPLIVPGSLKLETSSGDPLSPNAPLPSDGDVVFTGISEQTAFGNKVRISVMDLTDPDNPIVIGGFSGTKGDATDVAASWTDASGRFHVTVNPSVFSTDGIKVIGVRATDDAGVIGETAMVNVTLDLDSPVATGEAINVTQGVPFTGKVASFTDISGASCTARIQWEDGTETAGVLVANGSGGYDVIGTHTFATDGMFIISVTVTDPAGNPGTTVSCIATVADRQIVPTGAPSLTAVEGAGSNAMTVATFTDPGGAQTVDHYSAMIDWGDGQTSPGTITYDAQTQLFTVTGIHGYPDNTTKTVVTTISHNQLAALTVQGQMVVTNAKPVSTLTGPAVATVGVESVFNIGATDASSVDAAAGFTYVINWGDGSSVETIAARANNGQSAAIAHTFSRVGTFKVQVAATDKDGGTGYSQVLTVQVGKATAAQSVTINNGLAGRSIIRTVAFMPSLKGVRPDTLSLSQLKLLHNGIQEVSLKGASLSYRDGLATLDLNRVKLADGDYQLQVLFPRGQILTVDFFKLTGDADGSGVVDTTDRGIVRRNVGYSKGKRGYDPNADVDGDDAVTQDDVSLLADLMGHKLTYGKQWLNFYPNKPVAAPSLAFGTVKQRDVYSAIDLVIYNGRTSSLRIKGLDLADGRVCDLAVLGEVWSRPSDEVVIEAGKKLVVRVYVSASKLGTVWDQLKLQYSLNDGGKYTSLTLPITATIAS